MSSSATPSTEQTPGALLGTPIDDNSSPTVLFRHGEQVSRFLATPPSQTSPQILRLQNSPTSQAPLKPDQSYFSSRSSVRSSERGTYRPTHDTSPSDHLSTAYCASPNHSSNGSYLSSDNGFSLNSYSSSEYLTPPRFQPDCDKPPFKPRRRNSESLTMVRIKRAFTMPVGIRNSGRRRRRRKRKYQHQSTNKSREPSGHQDTSQWWLSGYHAGPSLCRHREVFRRQSRVYEDVSSYHPIDEAAARFRPTIRSYKASPAVPRRWSSVEVGAHRLPHDWDYVENRAGFTAIDSVLAPIDLSQRTRGSIFAPNAVEQEIVRSVRERLTLRRICPMPPKVPAVITLRRASGSSRASFVADINSSPVPLSRADLETQGTEEPSHNVQERPSETYLITSQDIDSITKLIEAKLKGFKEPNSTKRSSSGSEKSLKRLSRPSSILVNIGTSQELDALASDRLETKHVRSSALDLLQVRSHSRGKKPITPRINSTNGSHEVIWQNNVSVSPNSAGSCTDEDESKGSSNFGLSEPETPGNRADFEDGFEDGRGLQTETPEHSQTNFQGPMNAAAIINEWQDKISAMQTSSDDEITSKKKSRKGKVDPSPRSNLSPLDSPGLERSRSKPSVRYTQSVNQLQAVESFPPLPRRKVTDEWNSPLPEMEMYSPWMGRKISGHTGSSSKELTPKASQVLLGRSAQLSPSTSMEFSQTGKTPTERSKQQPNERLPTKGPEPNPQDGRRTSILYPDPHTSARTGSPPATDSSIAVGQGGRKWSSKAPARGVATLGVEPTIPRSSSELDEEPLPLLKNRMKRVHTIDNIDKGLRTDAHLRWRPPSVCPLPRAPSPDVDVNNKAESSSELPGTGPSNPRPSMSRIRDIFLDRLRLIRNISPPSVKVDPVGIYGQITGTRATKGDRDIHRELIDRGFHSCDDAERESQRDPSVDWIG